MSDDYEFVKDALRGMGGNRTAEEVAESIASLGRPVKNVEELLNRAAVEAKEEFLKTSDCGTYRYQYLRTRMRRRPVTLATSRK
jgi:hypothetical protein